MGQFPWYRHDDDTKENDDDDVEDNTAVCSTAMWLLEMAGRRLYALGITTSTISIPTTKKIIHVIVRLGWDRSGRRRVLLLISTIVVILVCVVVLLSTLRSQPPGGMADESD
jgi:hypothetical protein